jgi:hypothetical protein
MSAVAEGMERTLAALGEAEAHAWRLQMLLTLQYDEAGRPAVLVLGYARHLLAAALREAADGCEAVGVQQGDIRWTGPVALLHNASTCVATLSDPRTCREIADLMRRMREIVETLRHRGMSRDVSVRLH